MSPASLSSPRESKTSEKPNPATATIDASFDEDDDEIGDQERLEALKGLLFDSYRIQNSQGISLNHYMNDL